MVLDIGEYCGGVEIEIDPSLRVTEISDPGDYMLK